MNFFISFIIIIAVVVVTVVIARSIQHSHERASSSQMLWYGKDREYFIYEMLVSAFPRKSIFRNLYFPVKKDSETFWTEVDIVAVTHGGVAVIEVKGAKGSIENPETGEWTQRHGDKVLTFQNPHEQNRGHTAAVENALCRAGILKLPIFNIVVFTENNVRFTNRYKWLLRSNQIVDFIAELDDRFALSRKDIKNVDAALAQYTKKRGPSAAQMHGNAGARAK